MEHKGHEPGKDKATDKDKEMKKPGAHDVQPDRSDRESGKPVQLDPDKPKDRDRKDRDERRDREREDTARPSR